MLELKEVFIKRQKTNKMQENKNTTNPGMKCEPMLYAVMKLDRKIDVTVNCVTITAEMQDVAGYIPVFKTKAEAEKASFNGKFEILPISI